MDAKALGPLQIDRVLESLVEVAPMKLAMGIEFTLVELELNIVYLRTT